MVQIFAWLISCATALKHSERRAFLCRQSFDAEHSSGYNYGQFSAPGDECKVKLDEVGRFLIITSNGMPDHDHNTRNLRPQRIEISIPKHPTLLSEPECAGLGIVGIAVNGVPIYNSLTNDCCDSSLKNLHKIDECNGFADRNGVYRYQIYPTCLSNCEFGRPSGLVGVALDGFPIYGPVDDDGAQLRSADLDECHGKWHGSEYRYHITADYPYFISCFRGRVPSQNKESLTSQRLRSAGSYRGRRSYSWSESARMPSFSSYEKQKPIKMGDCKVCRTVTSCDNRTKSKTWSLIPHRGFNLKSSISDRFQRPVTTKPVVTTTSTTTRMEIKQVRQRPSTRTIKHDNHWPKMQVQNQRSLFSLYNPAPRAAAPSPTSTTHAPTTTTTAPKYRQFYAHNRGSFSAQRKQPLYRPLTQPTDAPFSYLYRRPTVATTTPKTFVQTPARFNSFYSNLQRLKTVSNSRANALPADFNLATELEKMRTDRIQLKMGKTSSNPALNLSPEELRQMLEDTHVTKVGKKVDPLVTLLEDENVPDNLKQDAQRYLKKSGGFGRKRRSYYNSYQPFYQPDDNIFDLLSQIRAARGDETTPNEAGFLINQQGAILLKCAPQRYKTAIPDSVDRLDPEMLAQILQERRGPMPVKRSRFGR